MEVKICGSTKCDLESISGNSTIQALAEADIRQDLQGAQNMSR